MKEIKPIDKNGTFALLDYHAWAVRPGEVMVGKRVMPNEGHYKEYMVALGVINKFLTEINETKEKRKI